MRIVACRGSITDAVPSLRGKQPRGWPPGSTWDSVPGVAFGNRVYVATMAKNGRRVVYPTGIRHGSLSLTVHEALHGYDFENRHRFIRSSAFKKARKAQYKTCLNAYQRQAGDAGLQETFAESGAGAFTVPKKYGQKCKALLRYWKSGAAKP